MSLKASNIIFHPDLDLSKGKILELTDDNDILRDETRKQIGVKVDLVTADGATVEKHDSSLENDHYALLLAQTDAALRCLNEGGDFVCTLKGACRRPVYGLLL